jgi:hypothetical protein
MSRDKAAPHASASNSPIDECVQRVAVTARLLLRCMWHCLLQHQRHQQLRPLQGRSTVSRVDTNRYNRPSQSRGSAVPSVASVITTTSRSVYRDVIERQKKMQNGNDLAPAPVPKSGSSAPPAAIPDVFSSSLSFTLLRSTLTMSLALLFLRRLHRAVGFVRPQQLQLSRDAFRRRAQRRAFFAWRESTRVAVRWRRWALRRCVDHWYQFVQHRLAIRGVLHRFLDGVRRRARSYYAVRALCSRRCLQIWSRSCTQRIIERQLAQRCAQYCHVKQLTNSEYVVRSDLHHDGESVLLAGRTGGAVNESLVSTAASVLSMLRTPQPHNLEMKAYCFSRWMSKTEERLNSYYAAALCRRRNTQRCFDLWKARWSLHDGALMSVHESQAWKGEQPFSQPSVVAFYHTSASPTQTVYRLKGFLIAKCTVRRFQVFRFWRDRWRKCVADRCYANSLLTRVLTIWMHRAADRRAALAVKGDVFRTWATRYCIRQQTVLADELHRAVKLQKSWRQWKLRLREHIVTQSSFKFLLRRCFHVWNDAGKVEQIASKRRMLTAKKCLQHWDRRVRCRHQRDMQELVAEALWQHIAMASALRRWKDRCEISVCSRIQEEHVLFAVDDRYRERLRQKCFAKWHRRRQGRAIAVQHRAVDPISQV